MRNRPERRARPPGRARRRCGRASRSRGAGDEGSVLVPLVAAARLALAGGAGRDQRAPGARRAGGAVRAAVLSVRGGAQPRRCRTARSTSRSHRPGEDASRRHARRRAAAARGPCPARPRRRSASMAGRSAVDSWRGCRGRSTSCRATVSASTARSRQPPPIEGFDYRPTSRARASVPSRARSRWRAIGQRSERIADGLAGCATRSPRGSTTSCRSPRPHSASGSCSASGPGSTRARRCVRARRPDPRGRDLGLEHRHRHRPRGRRPRPLRRRPGGRWTESAAIGAVVCELRDPRGPAPRWCAPRSWPARCWWRASVDRADTLPPRSPSPCSSCSLAAPALLWDVGFQLSALATAGLLAFAEPVDRRSDGLPRLVREPVALTVSAQLATLPVILASFERLSLVAPAGEHPRRSARPAGDGARARSLRPVGALLAPFGASRPSTSRRGPSAARPGSRCAR